MSELQDKVDKLRQSFNQIFSVVSKCLNEIGEIQKEIQKEEKKDA